MCIWSVGAAGIGCFSRYVVGAVVVGVIMVRSVPCGNVASSDIACVVGRFEITLVSVVWLVEGVHVSDGRGT